MIEKFKLQKRVNGIPDQYCDGKNIMDDVVIRLKKPLRIVKRWPKSNTKQADVSVPNPFKVLNDRMGSNLLVNCFVSIRFNK